MQFGEIPEWDSEKFENRIKVDYYIAQKRFWNYFLVF